MPTKIQWTDEVWNPVTGCTKIAAGCKNCYAERMAKRFWGGRKFGDVRCHPDRLDKPLKWGKPRLIFVDSMGDLFHEDVTIEFQMRVVNVMGKAKKHIFQVLTKRPERMRIFFTEYYKTMEKMPEEYRPLIPFPNVHLGVSCSKQEDLWMIDKLRLIDAAVHFVSLEPLLEDIGVIPWLFKLNQVIVGGESGPGARPMHPDWVRSIRDQCIAANVPFFFKQWGGVNKKKTGRVLDGKVWNQCVNI